jgi:CheY-like chemotaxis protein
MSPVLYADDEPDDIFFMHHVWELAEIPNPLIDVNNGKLAIDYLAGEGAFADRNKYPLPCLLLLDLNMPDKSGFDVLRWIRGDPARKSLKVVIISGSNRESDMKEAQDLGITDYIIKPSSPKKLLEIVQAKKSLWIPDLAREEKKR